jgi:hypothetical protein
MGPVRHMLLHCSMNAAPPEGIPRKTGSLESWSWRWPPLCAVLLAGASLVEWHHSYHRLLARHAWTAASLQAAFGWVQVAMAAVIGLILGRNLQILVCREPGRNRARSAAVVAALLGLVGFSAIQTWASNVEEANLESLRNDALSPERAWLLARGSREEQRAVAFNPTCPPEVLTVLAGSGDWAVRAYVGAHPRTPGRVLQTLRSDPVDVVRLNVLRNPALPREELKEETAHQAVDREYRNRRTRARGR